MLVEAIQSNNFHGTLLVETNGSKTNGPGLQSTRAVVNTIWRWCSVHGTPGGAERLIKLAWAGMPKNAGGIVRRALGAGSSNGWQTMAKQT